MPKEQSFIGHIRKVEDDKKAFAIKAIRHYQQFLNEFHENDTILVTIKKYSDKRTDAQNAFYWVYLRYISEDTGYTSEELHELFKGKFLTKEVKEILGFQTRIKGSTTELSKIEFSEYIDAIEKLTGIPAPDINEFV